MIGPIVKNTIKKPSALDDLNVPQMIRAVGHQLQSILYFFSLYFIKLSRAVVMAARLSFAVFNVRFCATEIMFGIN